MVHTQIFLVGPVHITRLIPVQSQARSQVSARFAQRLFVDICSHVAAQVPQPITAIQTDQPCTISIIVTISAVIWQPPSSSFFFFSFCMRFTAAACRRCSMQMPQHADPCSMQTATACRLPQHADCCSMQTTAACRRGEATHHAKGMAFPESHVVLGKQVVLIDPQL